MLLRICVMYNHGQANNLILELSHYHVVHENKTH